MCLKPTFYFSNNIPQHSHKAHLAHYIHLPLLYSYDFTASFIFFLIPPLPRGQSLKKISVGNPPKMTMSPFVFHLIYSEFTDSTTFFKSIFSYSISTMGESFSTLYFLALYTFPWAQDKNDDIDPTYTSQK